MGQDQVLNIIQFLHVLIDIFNCSYIFIFSSKYDIYFATWILLQTLHWLLLKNECIVSYIEKKIENPYYKLGSDPKRVPHNEVYFNEYTLTAKAIIILSTLLIIIYRAKTKTVQGIAGLAIVLWIYLTYFHNDIMKKIKKPNL
uniref:Uncharacterized protein n=1 Tax=viral metagenome TaxID=1070528 RepID=A0A6C0D552_9ZZZZ